MSLTIELARIFSIYFIVVGISILVNKSFYLTAVKDIASSNIAMLIIASITLILGVILVNLHNVWLDDRSVAITLFCWVVLFSGVIRTMFPTLVQKVAAKLPKNFVLFSSVICLVLGALYGYIGFINP